MFWFSQLDLRRIFPRSVLEKRKLVSNLGLVLIFASAGTCAHGETPEPLSETVSIDVSAKGRPFDHMWEHMFGSGRAILSLRQSYRDDLRKIKTVADVKYIRFHNIFHDEIGIYDEDKDGKPIYNFSYVDQIYDGLLENGVRPFVELSFMPSKLSAQPPAVHEFWYKPLVGPPKDWSKWGDLNYEFVKHLVERYGIDEVSQWYFEVWNEPDIDFWKGEPKQETYFRLYDTAANAIKRYSSRLRVGGPSTATQDWMADFIKHCVDKNVPLDFVSTHNYANEADEKAYKEKPMPRSDVLAGNVGKIHEIVKTSKRPDLPIFWSEYNASYMNEVNVTDSPFMGPWLANNIRLCDGLATGMSFWTFSDVFEEFGPVKKPFYGGFGVIAAGGIPKASFNAFKLLHMLGNERLENSSTQVLVTRDGSGKIKAALWNYGPAERAGVARNFKVDFTGLAAKKRVRIWQLDREHGSALTAWEKMGKPDFPTREQQENLKKAAELSNPIEMSLDEKNSISLRLEPQSLNLIELID